MLQPFWRETPLTLHEQALLEACLSAHAASARRSNISSSTVVQVAAGSGSYTNAIAAALLSVGNGLHAPLEYTIQLLAEENPAKEAASYLAEGRRIPGWGNSFHKGHPDPLWTDVHIQIARLDPHLAATIRQITDLLHAHGKKVHPNPSTFTASVAIILQLPPRLAPWLFLAGRLGEWSKATLPYLS